MSKKRIIALTFCVLAVVGIGICAVIPVLRLHFNTSIYIFSDISECNALEAPSVADVYFTKYQNTTQDNNLNGLQYTEFFAGKYFCEQYTFEIFAYEFADPLAAKTYFENATGKNANELDANFSMASGATTSHIVVFNGNMAYAVYCPSNSLFDVATVLEDHFQIKIK